MTKARPIIRPATSKDLDQFYGEDRPGGSMRVVVVDLDGDIVGIAGLAYHDDQMVAFSVIRDPLRGYPLTIMKTAMRLKDMIIKYGGNVLAIASGGEINSDKLLERMGFSFIGDTEDGRAYRWQIR